MTKEYIEFSNHIKQNMFKKLDSYLLELELGEGKFIRLLNEVSYGSYNKDKIIATIDEIKSITDPEWFIKHRNLAHCMSDFIIYAFFRNYIYA